MKDITIFDENYKKEDVENYRLAIQFSLDGFSFTTLDTISGKFNSFYYESLNDDIDFDDYLSSIENFLEKDILIKNYKSVSIVNEIPHSTLIPVSLFDKDKLKKIYEFNHVLDEYSSINYNRMRYSETYCIFSTPAFVSTLLINKFRKYDIFHQAVPFIDDVLKNIIDDEPKVVVNVSKSFFDILVVSEKKILLYNSYEIKNYVDIVYFVINCYEQLKLNRNNIPLLLTGIYDVKGDLVNTLDRFIANIIHETLKREDFLYEPIFKKVPVSRFPNLFKVLKCE